MTELFRTNNKLVYVTREKSNVFVSTQNDKKKKGFLQRHLPSSADNDKEPKNISPLSSPQVNRARIFKVHGAQESIPRD
jgi:hypothetical protein